MAFRTGIALTAGFVILAAAPITIDVLRHDSQSNAEAPITSTTIYTSYVIEEPAPAR